MANKQIIAVLIQLLREGQTAEVPASGISMYPLLQPGDLLLVHPQKPEIGDIGVFISGEKIIAHRLLKFSDDTYYFKGDSLIITDRPVKKEDILGTVIQRKRNNKSKNASSLVFRTFKKHMPKMTFVLGRLFNTYARIHQKICRTL